MEKAIHVPIYNTPEKLKIKTKGITVKGKRQGEQGGGRGGGVGEILDKTRSLKHNNN